VRRTADGLQVTADLPGLRREDIDIELLDGALRISGERGMEHEEEQEGVLRSERRYGRFERVIPLPEGVDEEAVTARFADGVLEVTVPLPKEAMKARKIEVR
jgi:HSP20 family protein